MGKFRLGLVGCGQMMSNHMRGVDQMENLELVAVCDTVYDRAKDVSDSLENHPTIYTDYTKMVDDVDGVLIALPHDLHYEVGMFFAENQKHVLMEKPLCNTEAECRSLIETCEKNNVTLMCAYPCRYMPGLLKLKELVDSGDFGEIMLFSIWTEQLTGMEDDRFGMRNANLLRGNKWMRSARLGGGQLFSHGCHYIDLLLWFLGKPVYGSHIGTKNGTPWMLREGTSAVTIKFENGAIGYHEGTWGARGSKLRYDFQLHTEKGMLEYDMYEGQIKLYDKYLPHEPGAMDTENGSYRVLWEQEYKGIPTQHEINHFVTCIQNGKTPNTHGRNALQGLRVIWELYNAEDNMRLADLRGMGFEEA